jgi:hypothetical protein
MSETKSRAMTDGQREYERKRAQRAGMTLEKWLDAKQKQAQAALPKVAKPARKPGLLSRLIERANRPLTKKS